MAEKQIVRPIKKKVTMTFRTSPDILKEVDARVILDGYGFHGKSHWIADSIENLLKMPNFWELVDIAVEQIDVGKAVNITISPELKKKIEVAVLEVRKHYPGMEGVKSNIIRASINQRLI